MGLQTESINSLYETEQSLHHSFTTQPNPQTNEKENEDMNPQLKT